VYLKGIRNGICIWTSDVPASDGARGGATHTDNFCRRFMAVPDVPVGDQPVEPARLPIVQAAPSDLSIDNEFGFISKRPECSEQLSSQFA